ncbi:MAG: ABC-F family ATP-binding cassette domain-containing protein [Acidimicrobiia bacterium]|nr:MAG: ABC-F family ATP-binding cassette domain-containing protein [Acidimicrobiia bacterium]
MILVRDLAIDAGARRLISAVSFSVQAGDKTGLVGPNGAGKTTLLRALAGLRRPASGSVVSNGVVGYLSQEAAIDELSDPDGTALERVLQARDIGALERRMEETRAEMEDEVGESRDRLIRRFSRLEDEFTARGGYVAKAEAKQFANALGIGADELDQPVATMSGGQRRRVELARILFAETTTLLLDEPTNHLDLDAKAWLMSYLAAYSGGLLLVSHDLALLDESITSVLAVDGGHIEPYRGNYTYYLTERERRRRQRLRERKHQDQKIARLEEGIRRFKGSSQKMAKRARTWETRVRKLEDQLVAVERRDRSVSVRFPQPETSGRTPLRAAGLAKAFGDNVVFVDVDVDVDRGERMLIMGLNGAGKTTLLRILAGIDRPDLGSVELGHRVSLGYYAQEHEDIESGVSVLDLMRVVSTVPDQALRTILGHFLLADKVDQDAGTLSGGEKTKLALARLVVARPNVLLLDEPTNNLDPQAKEALLQALDQYQGTLILVSHDTAFVGALAPDRVILMPDGEHAYFDDSMLELVELA